MAAKKAPNPKSAAMEALIEAHAAELKLPTVKARFRAMAEEATRDQQTPIAYLAPCSRQSTWSGPSDVNAGAWSKPASR